MAKKYWLVKQEPEAYSWEDFVKDKRTLWTGVRNFQARNHLRTMAIGDEVLFYASVSTKAIQGIAKVTETAKPDPTATDGDWSVVELEAIKPFPKEVTLAQIKQTEQLSEIGLIKQSRLSVMPLSNVEYKTLLKMGGL